MKIQLLTIVAALLAFTGVAQAHTHLEQSMPADNALLTSPPSEIMLHFSEAARLTSLSIRREGEEEQKITSLPKERAAALSVPLDTLTPGKYTVNWRVIGGDNHVMSGVVHFTVAAK